MEVGATTIVVGVIHFHGKDLSDLNSCTVFLPFMAEESMAVTESPRSRVETVHPEIKVQSLHFLIRGWGTPTPQTHLSPTDPPRWGPHNKKTSRWCSCHKSK